MLDNGNILFSHSLNYVCERVAKTESYTHHSNVILPPSSPKYDPCRLFKKGDKVRVVSWNGRKLKMFDMSDVWEVAFGETPGDLAVSLRRKCAKTWENCCVPPCYLELVTPVEELEPYSVGESSDYFSVDKDDEELCLFWKDKHPHAKEAAEAECARLNAAHRKEHA